MEITIEVTEQDTIVALRRQRWSPSAHLDELHRQLAVEGGHLPLHAQLPATDGEGDGLVVGGAVADALEDVQVLHHHVAVETHIKHLEEGGKVRKGVCVCVWQRRRH